MGLFITGFFLYQLFDETLALIIRIIQLGESVCQFTANHKELETINNARILIILTRQRRDFCRVLGNKRRLPQFRFYHRIENFHQQLAVTDLLVEFQTKLASICQQLSMIINIGLTDIAIFEYRVTHGQTLPGAAQVNIAFAILELQTTNHLFCHMTDQLFG